MWLVTKSHVVGKNIEGEKNLNSEHVFKQTQFWTETKSTFHKK